MLTMLGLIIAGVVALAFLELLIRRPTAAAATFFGVVVVSAAAGKSLTLTTVGGISLKLDDLFFSLLVAAAVARYLRWKELNAGQRVVLGLAALVFFSFMRGIPSFGLVDATNEFRGLLPYVGGALYFSTVLDDTDLQGIFKAWVWSGVPLILLVLLRWASWLGGVSIGPLEVIYDAPIRVLDGPQTFFLVQTGLVALLSAPRVSIGLLGQRHLGLVFLFVSVLLNRRTAWATLVVGLAIVVVRGSQLTPRARRSVLGASVVVVVLLYSFSGGFGEHSVAPASSEEEVAQGFDDTGTLNWRIAGWQEILSEPRDPVEWLVGVPFGTGFIRTIDFREVDSNPHSFYVQAFGRAGIFGAALLLIILLGGAWKLSRRTSRPFRPFQRSGQELLFTLLAMNIIWFATWPPGMDGGLVAGLVAGYGFHVGQRQRSGAPNLAAASPNASDSRDTDSFPGATDRSVR